MRKIFDSDTLLIRKYGSRKAFTIIDHIAVFRYASSLAAVPTKGMPDAISCRETATSNSRSISFIRFVWCSRSPITRFPEIHPAGLTRDA